MILVVVRDMIYVRDVFVMEDEDVPSRDIDRHRMLQGWKNDGMPHSGRSLGDHESVRFYNFLPKGNDDGRTRRPKA